MLARGGAKVTQRIGDKDVLIQNLQVGGIIGEMASLSPASRRSASVTATTTSLFFQIPGEAMTELVSSSNLLRTHLWTVCARRLAEITLSEHEPYRQMTRRMLRNTLQSWNLIDPPRRKFGGKINGKRNSELIPTAFQGELFLAYGTLTRQIKNLDHSNNKNSNKSCNAFIPRGKSSKLLLEEEDRCNENYELQIFAPSFLKPMAHEDYILGWASPNAVILSSTDTDSILGHRLSARLSTSNDVGSESETVRQQNEMEMKNIQSKYSVVDIKNGG